MSDHKLKELERLISDKTDVLWIIALRDASALQKIELADSACPSCLKRRALNYSFLNDDQLNQELMMLCEMLDQQLETFNPYTLKDLLQ